MLNLLSREQWNNILGKQWNLFFIGTGSLNSIKSGGLWIIWYRIEVYKRQSRANVYWNHRMFLSTGDAKYADVLERALYNGVISGVSLSGDKFFYCLLYTSPYLIR